MKSSLGIIAGCIILAFTGDAEEALRDNSAKEIAVAFARTLNDGATRPKSMLKYVEIPFVYFTFSDPPVPTVMRSEKEVETHFRGEKAPGAWEGATILLRSTVRFDGTKEKLNEPSEYEKVLAKANRIVYVEMQRNGRTREIGMWLFASKTSAKIAGYTMADFK